MPTTNIAFCRHIDGRQLEAADIHAGLEVYFPCAAGGEIKHKCANVNSEQAIFKSINKEWPGEEVVEFNQPDLTREEFVQLSGALERFNSWNKTPTEKDRAVVHHAKRLGYAYVQSYTQAQWTEAGVARYRAHNFSSH